MKYLTAIKLSIIATVLSLMSFYTNLREAKSLKEGLAVLSATPMLANQRGNVTGAIVSIFGGMMVFVIGSALTVVVIANAATSGSNAQIGSFSGTRGVNDLQPLIFTGGLILVGIGIMVVGGVQYKRNALG